MDWLRRVLGGKGAADAPAGPGESTPVAPVRDIPRGVDLLSLLAPEARRHVRTAWHPDVLTFAWARS